MSECKDIVDLAERVMSTLSPSSPIEKHLYLSETSLVYELGNGIASASVHIQGFVSAHKQQSIMTLRHEFLDEPVRYRVTEFEFRGEQMYRLLAPIDEVTSSIKTICDRAASRGVDWTGLVFTTHLLQILLPDDALTGAFALPDRYATPLTLSNDEGLVALRSFKQEDEEDTIGYAIRSENKEPIVWNGYVQGLRDVTLGTMTLLSALQDESACVDRILKAYMNPSKCHPEEVEESEGGKVIALDRKGRR